MKYQIEQILIVDPEKASAEATREIILKTGIVKDVALSYDVFSAMNFYKQRLAVGKSMPNITFTEIQLPDKSGWEFLETYSAQYGQNPSMHEIYFLTASYNTRDMIQCGLHPLTEGYINKPVSDLEIKRILSDYLEKISLTAA